MEGGGEEEVGRGEGRIKREPSHSNSRGYLQGCFHVTTNSLTSNPSQSPEDRLCSPHGDDLVR